jgi:hypothetical protein
MLLTQKVDQCFDAQVINSSNITAFKSQFSNIANQEYTEDMLAREEQQLEKDRRSTEVLSKLKPIIFERQKLFTQRYETILECLKHGFENEQQRTQLTIEFANAYSEFKKVLAKLYFGLDQQAKATNSYLSSYGKR